MLDASAPGAALKPWRLAKERLDRMAGELRRAQTASALSRAVRVAGSLARKLRNFLAYQVGKAWREARDDIRLRLLRASLDRGRRPPRLVGQVSATIAYLYAEREYRPEGRLEEGYLVLFRAMQGEGIDAPFIDFYEDPQLGWSSCSRHGVRTVDVPGGHTSMLQEPYVDELARRMQESIDESLAKGERAVSADGVRPDAAGSGASRYVG